MQRRYIYHPLLNRYLTFNGNNSPVTLEKYLADDSTRQQWDITDAPAESTHQIRSVANPEQCLDTKVEYILPQRSYLYTMPCGSSPNDLRFQQWIFTNPIKENDRYHFQVRNPNFKQSYWDTTSNTAVEPDVKRSIPGYRYLSYFREQGLPDPKPSTDVYFSSSDAYDKYQRFTFPTISE